MTPSGGSLLDSRDLKSSLPDLTSLFSGGDCVPGSPSPSPALERRPRALALGVSGSGLRGVRKRKTARGRTPGTSTGSCQSPSAPAPGQGGGCLSVDPALDTGTPASPVQPQGLGLQPRFYLSQLLNFLACKTGKRL